MATVLRFFLNSLIYIVKQVFCECVAMKDRYTCYKFTRITLHPCTHLIHRTTHCCLYIYLLPFTLSFVESSFTESIQPILDLPLTLLLCPKNKHFLYGAYASYNKVVLFQALLLTYEVGSFCLSLNQITL